MNSKLIISSSSLSSNGSISKISSCNYSVKTNCSSTSNICKLTGNNTIFRNSSAGRIANVTKRFANNIQLNGKPRPQSCRMSRPEVGHMQYFVHLDYAPKPHSSRLEIRSHHEKGTLNGYNDKVFVLNTEEPANDVINDMQMQSQNMNHIAGANLSKRYTKCLSAGRVRQMRENVPKTHSDSLRRLSNYNSCLLKWRTDEFKRVHNNLLLSRPVNVVSNDLLETKSLPENFRTGSQHNVFLKSDDMRVPEVDFTSLDNDLNDPKEIDVNIAMLEERIHQIDEEIERLVMEANAYYESHGPDIKDPETSFSGIPCYRGINIHTNLTGGKSSQGTNIGTGPDDDLTEFKISVSQGATLIFENSKFPNKCSEHDMFAIIDQLVSEIDLGYDIN